ncbi:MAG: hypothetical protein A2Y88_03015 [Chloroflexi bacterium RBG_13_48_10]|nr:MAG: hypothetical protein A2Y88_03015 [Chloroflexi bacterium RBG_13_48_10]
MITKRLLTVSLIVTFTLLSVLGGLVLLNAWSVQAASSILYVAPGGACGGASPCYSTLQDAVDAAQPGDEIRVAVGMYGIQAGTDQVVKVDKNLTLIGGYTTSDWNSPDASSNPTILNAFTQGRVMVISGTLDVTVQGLRLVLGDATGLGGYPFCYSEHDAGGGLYINKATVTLDQTWVLTNTAPSNGYGGGLFATDATLWLRNETIIRANEGGAGGGLYLTNSKANLNLVYVNDNEAGGPWGGCQHGGGGLNIVSGSQVEIMNSAIKGNRKLITTSGAGILHEDGHLVIHSSLIEENEGTAVQLVNYSQGTPTAILSGNVIRNNGGTGVSGSAITMTNNLVLGNDVDGWAGGITIDGAAFLQGNIILNNYTHGNSSFKGGGVYLRGYENSPILFKGNLVQGNHSSIASGGKGGGIYVEGQNVTLDGNIIQGNSAYAGITDLSGSGGGIYIGGDVTLLNNIVTDNSVNGPTGRGAGITIAGAQPILSHNTIARNTGASGDGIYVTAAGEPGQPLLYNTIIVSQTVGVVVNPASTNNMAYLDGVLWWANDTNTTGLAYIFNPVEGSPEFVDPNNYDYHIGTSSSAIDAGINAGVTSDIDREPRFGTPDLGADEHWVPGALKRVYLPLALK